jgi:hypothetical protein
MDLAYQLLWKTQALGEATDLSCHELMHVLNHGNFALLSGGARNEQLRTHLETAGYRITPAVGNYAGAEEYMYMVHDPNEKDMTALAEKYHQQSIVLSNKGATRLVVTHGPHKGRTRVGHGWHIAASQDANYTQIETSDGETVRFRLEL